MPIDDDRQPKANNRTGAELAFLEAIDALDAPPMPFTPPVAAVERAERNRAEHEHAKVNGFKATRNHAISAWRKTDLGRVGRNEQDRIEYAHEKARQGDTVRAYDHLAPLGDEARAERVRTQNAKSQHKRRKNLTDNMTDAERAAHRQAESAKRAARRAKAKKF